MAPSGVEFSLALTPLPRAARAAEAFLLPGDEPGRWLDGLGALARRLGVEAATFELWLVPGAGLLARSPRGAGPVAGPEVAPAQAYGRAGARLLLPVDGALSPDVTGAELDLLLGSGLHLLHPWVGLVRLAAEARLSALDLLARPPEVQGAWRALEPPTAPLRLTSVEVQDPPPLESFLRQGGAGVAEAPPSQAPPSPGEQAGGAGGWLGQQAARFVQWAAGGESSARPPAPTPPAPTPPAPTPPAPTPPAPTKPDEPAAGGGLLDRLLRWSERTLGDVQDARQRELDRLLHLLDTDPDEGLRYALPLTGDSSGGGAPARPGSALPPRHVDYGAGRARRGDASDAWELDLQRHLRLAQRYRELAGRELRLGRFRRAAYVYAELLGDHGAAASALEQGRHFREAAALYGERLGRPLEAARCLERGGLLVEAAALFEGQGRWVEAGDVWTRLARQDDARRAYRRAVEARLQLNDPLSAARLLETKLDDVDEALEVLAATWPEHAQAGLCLEDRLGLLGRHGRHQATREVLDGLRRDARGQDAGGPARALVLGRALSSAAARYPEAGVQARARDLVRVVAGERLASSVGPAEAEALLQVIARLDPDDRLLGRDVGRMAAQRRRDAARARASGARALRGEGWAPHVSREKRLLPRVAGSAWRDVAVHGELIWALGALSGARPSVFVQRERWGDLTPQVVNWPWSGGEPLLLATSARGDAPALVVAGGRRRLDVQVLPAQPDVPSCEVGTPAWLEPPVLAVASDALALRWVLSPGGAAEAGLVLRSYDVSGRLLGTCAVRAPDDDAARSAEAPLGDVVGSADADDSVEAPPLLRATNAGRVLLAHGGQLLRLHGTEPVASRPLERPARDLALLDAPFAAAVSHDDGGRLYFDDERHAPQRFGQGLHAPRVAFTPDGLLVVVTPTEGRVYLVRASALEHKGTFEGPGAAVLCVRPTGRAREVVVVTVDGTLRALTFARSE